MDVANSGTDESDIEACEKLIDVLECHHRYFQVQFGLGITSSMCAEIGGVDKRFEIGCFTLGH